MAELGVEPPSEMNYYDHDNETEELIRDSVSDICQDVMKAIDGAWLNGLEIPIATTVAMHKLRQIVNLSIYPMDGVIPGLEVRVPDREPAPPSIDSWARGVVPTRQKVQTDDERFMSRMGSESATPSVSSYRSGKSGTKMSAFGGTRSRVSSGEFSRSRGNTAGDNYGDPEIFDLGDSRPSTGDGNKMNDKFEKYKRAQRRKNKNGPIVTDMVEKDEFEVMKETLENGKKNLKGKRFAIDSDGKPIPIAGTRPEDLPRFSMDLAANISSFHQADPVDEVPIENKANSENKKGKKVRIAGSRNIEESFFVPSKTLATALSETGTEKFDMKPGVSLKAGQVTVEGPAAPSDPKRMSRKDFLEKRRGGGTDTGSVTSTLYTGGLGQEGLDAGNSIGSLDSDLMGMSRTSRLTDVDVMEGGKKKSPLDSSVRTVTDRELGLGPIQASGQAQASQLPKKASAKQHEIMKDFNGGTDKAGPRDRLPPGIAVPTSQKKKLPPPSAGKTMGHGLGDNSSIRSSPNKNSNYDNYSLGGDNSTIHTASIMSQRTQKKEQGTVKLANSEIARELY